jgi:hypothetical protein
VYSKGIKPSLLIEEFTKYLPAISPRHYLV